MIRQTLIAAAGATLLLGLAGCAGTPAPDATATINSVEGEFDGDVRVDLTRDDSFLTADAKELGIVGVITTLTNIGDEPLTDLREADLQQSGDILVGLDQIQQIDTALIPEVCAWQPLDVENEFTWIDYQSDVIPLDPGESVTFCDSVNLNGVTEGRFNIAGVHSALGAHADIDIQAFLK